MSGFLGIELKQLDKKNILTNKDKYAKSNSTVIQSRIHIFSYWDTYTQYTQKHMQQHIHTTYILEYIYHEFI